MITVFPTLTTLVYSSYIYIYKHPANDFDPSSLNICNAIFNTVQRKTHKTLLLRGKFETAFPRILKTKFIINYFFIFLYCFDMLIIKIIF